MYCFHCMKQMPDDADTCPYCSNPVYREAGTHHLQPGTVLLGKYLIGKAIGEGGFGITYVGIDVNLELKIAVKEYYPKGYANRNTATHEVTITVPTTGNSYYLRGKQKFLQEARTLAKFNREPNIVNVRDFFELNQTAYIIMDFVSGKTLKQYINENGKIAPDQLLKWFIPLLKALDRVHSGGLIHRDISPDNILLEDGKLVLIDFGASRDTTTDVSLSVILKPGYAPGEQYYSHGNQGPWTDIYALCATMYKCLTGVTPPESSSRMFEDTLQAPSELGISLPTAMEAALMRGLSNRYQERQQNITELIGELTGESVCRIPAESHAVMVTAGEKAVESEPHLVSEHHMPEEVEDDSATVYEPIGDVSEKERSVSVPVTLSPAPAPQPVAPVPVSAPEQASPSPEIKRFVPPEERPALPPSEPFVLSNGAAAQGEKKKSGKTFKIVVASVAVLAVAAVGIGIALKNSKSEPEKTTPVAEVKQSQAVSVPQETNAVQKEEPAASQAAPAVVDAKDALEDGTFTLDGVDYTLPCKYSQFTDNGWTLTNVKESATINGNDKQYATMAKGGKKIELLFKNASGDRKLIPDCPIVGLTAYTKQLGDASMLKVGGNQVLSMSTSQLKEAFGIPSFTNKGSSTETYKFEKSDTQYGKFVYYSGVIDHFELRKEGDAEKQSEPSGGVVSALSDDLQDFTFKLDGVCYQLPCSYQDLTKNGWVLSYGPDESSTLESGKSEYVKLSKAGNNVELTVKNMTEGQQQLSNCTVASIEAQLKEVDGKDYFQIAKQISPYSTKDEIIAAFGTPNTTNEGSADYISLKYSFNNGSSDPSVSFMLYDSDSMKKYSTVKLTCSKAFEHKALNTYKPEYLSQYVAPKELGTDLKSGNFELEGKVCHLPVPIEELLNDGWTFKDKPASVPAGKTQSAELAKDGKKLIIRVKNFGDYESAVENTMVCTVSIDSRDENSGEMVLPGGVKIGTAEGDLKKLLPSDVKTYDSDQYIWYDFSLKQHIFDMEITTDIKSGKVTKMRISADDLWLLEE